MRPLDATIMDQLDDGIFVTDGQGVILYVNRAYERITGLSKEDLLGKSVTQTLLEGLFDKSVTMEVLASHKVVKEIETIKTNKQAMVISNPIFDAAGNITMVVTIVRDLTDLGYFERKIEEARRLNLQYRAERESWYEYFLERQNIIAYSDAMRKVIYLVHRISNMDTTVLITGESGVGKDVVARLIHHLSERKDGPFIKINCGAIPDTLLESELFGYEKGAFTSASTWGKPGLVELASKGTLFLDEIGELSVYLQPKILRLVQEKEYLRVGGTKFRKADIRIIAATNRDLNMMVNKGEFRMDLYYRLNVFPIHVPPLRERREDILPLANQSLDRLNKKYATNKRFSRDVMQFFVNYDWPGNVRQLENLVEHLYIVSKGDLILREDIYLHPDFGQVHKLPQRSGKLDQLISELETTAIKNALERTGSPAAAAALLRIHRTTLVRKAKKYGIAIKDRRQALGT